MKAASNPPQIAAAARVRGLAVRVTLYPGLRGLALGYTLPPAYAGSRFRVTLYVEPA